jgi:D-aminoacyl-tRNA deacylase
MRLLVQCVQNASVTIEGKIVSSIGRGELVFVGFKTGDNEAIADKMIAKLLKLRIFPDEKGMTNLSLSQIAGQLLCVSQFTLYASAKDGNRPAFVNCMPVEDARKLYEKFTEKMKAAFPNTQFGVFQADMKVSLLNDGPFTVLLDSEELGYGD